MSDRKARNGRRQSFRKTIVSWSNSRFIPFRRRQGQDVSYRPGIPSVDTADERSRSRSGERRRDTTRTLVEEFPENSHWLHVPHPDDDGKQIPFWNDRVTSEPVQGVDNPHNTSVDRKISSGTKQQPLITTPSLPGQAKTMPGPSVERQRRLVYQTDSTPPRSATPNPTMSSYPLHLKSVPAIPDPSTSTTRKRKSLHITEIDESTAGKTLAEGTKSIGNELSSDSSVKDFASSDQVSSPQSSLSRSSTAYESKLPQRTGSLGSDCSTVFDSIYGRASYPTAHNVPSLSVDFPYPESSIQKGKRGSLDGHWLLNRVMAYTPDNNHSLPDLNSIHNSSIRRTLRTDNSSHSTCPFATLGLRHPRPMLAQALSVENKQQEPVISVDEDTQDPEHPSPSQRFGNASKESSRPAVIDESLILDQDRTHLITAKCKIVERMDPEIDPGPPLKRKKKIPNESSDSLEDHASLHLDKLFDSSGVCEVKASETKNTMKIVKVEPRSEEAAWDMKPIANVVIESPNDCSRSFDEVVRETSVYQRAVGHNPARLSPGAESPTDGGLRAPTGSEFSYSVAATSDDNSSCTTDYSAMGWKDSVDPENIHGLALSVLDDLKNDMVRRVMEQLYNLLDTEGVNHETTQGGSPSSHNSGSTALRSNGQSSQARGKRRISDRDGDGTGDENDDDPSKRPRQWHQDTKNSRPAEPRKLACPFFKHDCSKHQRWPSCAGPGWKDVHRMKEHMYRRHCPIVCARCFQIFENVELRDEHSRLDLQCQVLSSRPENFEGMDSGQEKKLRSRKHPKGQSQKEKWDEIYKILFPEDLVIPEPYYEDENLEHRRSATSDDFNKWEQYLRDVLPKMVSDSIKPRADTMTEGLIEQLPDIIRNCQEEAFNNYRQAHQPTSASPPCTGDRLAPIAIAPPPMPIEHDQPSSAQIASSINFQDGSGAGSSLDSGYLSVPHRPSWSHYPNLGDQGATTLSTGSAPMVNKPLTAEPNAPPFNEDIFSLELGQENLLPIITGSTSVPGETNQFHIPAILLNKPPGPTMTANQRDTGSNTGSGMQIQTDTSVYERPKDGEAPGNMTDRESEALFLDSWKEFGST